MVMNSDNRQNDTTDFNESSPVICYGPPTQTQDNFVLLYSSDDPAEVAEVQDKLGRDKAGSIVEHAFAEVARRLSQGGLTRLLVAGGETSGATVLGLGIRTLEIGPEIDPGVPWTRVVDGIRFINTGSVGRPKDGDWRAGYVLLDVGTEETQVEFVRVPYDVESAARGVIAAGLPEEYAEFLRTGGKPTPVATA